MPIILSLRSIAMLLFCKPIVLFLLAGVVVPMMLFNQQFFPPYPCQPIPPASRTPIPNRIYTIRLHLVYVVYQIRKEQYTASTREQRGLSACVRIQWQQPPALLPPAPAKVWTAQPTRTMYILWNGMLTRSVDCYRRAAVFTHTYSMPFSIVLHSWVHCVPVSIPSPLSFSVSFSVFSQSQCFPETRKYASTWANYNVQQRRHHRSSFKAFN